MGAAHDNRKRGSRPAFRIRPCQAMKSNRQRRREIAQRRDGKRLARAMAKTIDERARRLDGQVLVDPANLRPTNSYGVPEFVRRGFYVDTPFVCRDCGKEDTWTAAQQKWWYEVAQGDVRTIAIHCRACRKKESARKAAARKARLDGLERKRAAGKATAEAAVRHDRPDDTGPP